MLKWAIELGQFDINYRPWIVIKGQALIDFITEITYSNIVEVARTVDNAEVAKEVEMEKSEVSTTKQEDRDLGGE